ncbi:helix-turn-helix domain-containing protein [Nonomuraea sp. NBC_00507]|uniref:helix-turn-helix domain-containing protein n=1 Tax=Nonomuraea sp. NBC_00507 TaxID=2976002 RepID=UPI002E18DEA6
MRLRRIAAGLKQKTLADLAELSEAHVSLIENGKRSPGADVLKRLATALDCAIEDLMAVEEPMHLEGPELQ